MCPRPRPAGIEPPRWRWSARLDDLAVSFLGRAGAPEPADLLHHLDPPPTELAWLSQVHSDRVCEAREGWSGEGDALVTTESELALAVSTADCVPVLLAAPGWIAAVHAGWRGVEAGVVGATLERAPAGESVAAWIGPAIGPCCYEVGDEVAERVVAASTQAIVAPGRRDRPHLDLPAAVEHQLGGHGVERIRRIDRCTHCETDFLWSYRRDAEAAGRNWSVIWRTTPRN